MKLELELTDELPAELVEQIARRVAELVAVPDPPKDGWLSPSELADRLGGVSLRWIGYRKAEGMPFAMIAGRPKYKLAEVEPWLEEHGHLTRCATLNQSRTDATGAAPAGNGHRPRHEE